MMILYAILAALILICAFTPLLSFWGHDCLYEDGSVSGYNMFHKQTEAYTSGQIAHIHFSVVARKKAHYVAMELTTTDGESFYFQSSYFDQTDQSWLIWMQKIKDQYPETMISYDTRRIDRLIAYKQFNETEKSQLYKLFNLEP